MKTRKIHLYNICQRIDALKIGLTPPMRGIISSMISIVKTIDEKTKQIFKKYQQELFHLDGTEEGFASIQEKFNREYVEITKELESVADDLEARCKEFFPLDSLNPTDVLNAKELKSVVEDLRKMTKVTIDFTYDWHKKSLYNFCSILGGVSIKIGQGMLPTAGVVELEQDKLEQTKGICGGMVIEWADDSVQYGTCRYPVTSTGDVLRKQVKQSSIKGSKFYEEDQIYSYKTIDFADKFNHLIENIPYYISMHSPDGGHAIGIRKHKTHIEIFDPNYGYFFFRDIRNGSAWISILFQSYASKKFPCEEIKFFLFDTDKPDSIPNSTFPSALMLGQASIAPYSADGYKKLLTEMSSHLYMLLCGDKERLVELVIKAMLTFNQYLCLEDSQRMVNVINSFIDPAIKSSVEDKKFVFIDPKIYQECKKYFADASKELLKETKAALEKSYHVNLPIDPAIMNAIERFEAVTRDCNQRMHELSTELSDEKRKKRLQDPEKIRRLQNHIDILNLKRNNLRRSDIASKLRAAVHGMLQYTADQAHVDMTKTLGNALDIEMLQPHLAMLERIDCVRDGFTVCKDQFVFVNNDVDVEGGDLHNIRLRNINNLQRRIVSIADEQLAELNRIRARVLEQNNLDAIEQEFNVKFAELLPRDAYGYMRWLNETLEAVTKVKYNADEMRALDNMLQLVSNDSDTSVIPHLIIAATHAKDNLPLQHLLNSLIRRAHNMRFVLMDAIDRTSPHRPAILELQQELQDIMDTKENPVVAVSESPVVKKSQTIRASAVQSSVVDVRNNNNIINNNNDSNAEAKPIVSSPAKSPNDKHKKKLFLVMSQSVKLSLIKASVISMFGKSPTRIGRRTYSNEHIVAILSDYLNKETRAEKVYSCAFSTRDAAAKYIAQENLRGWEDNNPKKYKNESTYTGPDFAPFVFEIEIDLRDPNRDTYILSHDDLSRCHVVNAHLEDSVYPINQSLYYATHVSFSDFKAAYFKKYEKQTGKNPTSAMKVMLETDKVTNISQVFEFAVEHPDSRSAKILRKLTSK